MAEGQLQETSASQHTCRVCQEPEEASNFIQPCRCDGTIKYIHKECLQGVMRSTNKLYRCEVCNSRYRIRFRIIRKSLIELFRSQPSGLILVLSIALLVSALIWYRICVIKGSTFESVNDNTFVYLLVKNGIDRRFLRMVRNAILLSYWVNLLVIVSLLFMVVYGLWKVDYKAIEIID